MAANGNPPGKLMVIGFGPGSHDHLTFRGKQAIAEADWVVGYTTYINLVADLIEDKGTVKTGMREEVSRAIKAVELARQGHKVAVVSSGDAGIYGMAGLIFEVLQEQGWKPGPDEIGVEVIPGVPALNAVASLVGAPLVHDFASISLSDLLTPWEVIAKRLEAAGEADFVVILYNPKSGRRVQQIIEAQRILLKYRQPTTPVCIVKSAYREAQHIVLTDLEHMNDFEIGMLTTIIIGNTTTFIYEGLMITPRGYRSKYKLSDDEQ